MDYGYTGQPLDANGLAYHRARYYDTSMGVWNSQDPLELMNRYGYVDGNPIRFTDESGLTRFPCIGGRDESTGRCKGYQITDAINDAIPQEEIADGFVDATNAIADFVETKTYGVISADMYRSAVAANIGVADDVVNFVEDNSVELIAGTLLAGGAAIVAAPASAGALAGGSYLTVAQQGAAVGASTNLIGGLITGRYTNADSTEELIGKIFFDIVIGGAAGAAFSKIPTLGEMTKNAGSGGTSLFNILNRAQHAVSGGSRHIFGARKDPTPLIPIVNYISRVNPLLNRAMRAGGITAIQGFATRQVDTNLFGDEGPDTPSEWVTTIVQDFMTGGFTMLFTDKVITRYVGGQTNNGQDLLNLPPTGRKWGKIINQQGHTIHAHYNEATRVMQGLTAEEISLMLNTNLTVPIFQDEINSITETALNCMEQINPLK